MRRSNANKFVIYGNQKIVDALYGDQISDDPYQPQEVHLSLTAEPTSMKVMWVTMDTLQEAQVQYLPYSRLSANWNTASVRYATNQTYSVPQKWYMIHSLLTYVQRTYIHA